MCKTCTGKKFKHSWNTRVDLDKCKDFLWSYTNSFIKITFLPILRYKLNTIPRKVPTMHFMELQVDIEVCMEKEM